MAGIYLVRHGHAERGTLTAEGRKESESTRDILLGKGLGSSALILSSDSPRALRTAEIIAEGLKVANVMRTNCMSEAGNDPEVVNSLDLVLTACLANQGVQELTDGLVVVTHMPLISHARFGDRYEVTQNGEVWEYPPGSWVNPHYDPTNAQTMTFEQDLGIR